MPPSRDVEPNIWTLFEDTAQQAPDVPAVIHRDVQTSYAQLYARSRRLAEFLAGQGLGCFTERGELENFETGQHLLGQYLHNGREYVEGMLGAYGARVAPFNINFRYRRDELRYLFADAKPAAIMYHDRFAGTLAEALDGQRDTPVLLQVADDTGAELIPGSLRYDEIVSAAGPTAALDEPRPDDLYVVYTGGTTGMPKGVLWRQIDLLRAIGSTRFKAARAPRPPAGSAAQRVMPCGPLIHGAAQWAVLRATTEGNTLVFPDEVTRFSAAEILRAVQRHRVSAVTIVGDAFGWPLADELAAKPYDVSSLRVVVSGGTALTEACRNALRTRIRGVHIIENLGSSESGVQGLNTDATDTTPHFTPTANTLVISEDRTRALTPGDPEIGWLARRGAIPLGYLNDADKTAQAFPVVAGVRAAVPGDRARLRADGRIELLGRDSLTINTGGEKVFVEEVEAVVNQLPGVADNLVCGRPSAKWGREVVALVQPAEPGLEPGDVIAYVRGRLAGYKVPKHVVLVDHVERSVVGKGDYAWAVRTAESALAGEAEFGSAHPIQTGSQK